MILLASRHRIPQTDRVGDTTDRPASHDEIVIDTLGPGDEAAVLDCLSEGFSFQADRGRWHHLFFESPGGKSIILVARSGRKIVSHYGVLRRRIVAFGKAGIAAHAIDATTRRGWQRRGIKTKLALAARDRISEAGLDVSYAFNNDQSQPGALKYDGATAVHDLPIMVRPLRPLRAAIRYIRGKFAFGGTAGSEPVPEAATSGPLAVDADEKETAADYHGWCRPRFDDRHTALFERAEGLAPIAVVRDRAHLEWRYPSGETSPYLQRDLEIDGQIVSSAIVRVVDLFGIKSLLIMDWVWADGFETHGARLLRDAVALGKRLGATAASAIAMPGTLHRRLLRRAGFLAVPSFLRPRSVYFVVRLDRNDPDPLRWMEASNWYLTWGDGFIV